MQPQNSAWLVLTVCLQASTDTVQARRVANSNRSGCNRSRTVHEGSAAPPIHNELAHVPTSALLDPIIRRGLSSMCLASVAPLLAQVVQSIGAKSPVHNSATMPFLF